MESNSILPHFLAPFSVNVKVTGLCEVSRPSPASMLGCVCTLSLTHTHTLCRRVRKARVCVAASRRNSTGARP